MIPPYYIVHIKWRLGGPAQEATGKYWGECWNVYNHQLFYIASFSTEAEAREFVPKVTLEIIEPPSGLWEKMEEK